MTHKEIILHDKKFRKFIRYSDIEKAIGKVAARINKDYRDKETPLFIGVLNGSFMFMAELFKRIDFNCESSFVRIASYEGSSTTGTVTEILGLSDNIRGRHVIIVEDIVDTGGSIEYMMRSISGHEPASVAVATLLFKPEAYIKDYKIDYYALAVNDKFIVGFGLDYDQLGRNLTDLYTAIDE